MIASPKKSNTDARCLHIGLVNNMPDAALEATERQFRTLLWEAAEGLTIHFSLFTIPEVPRSDKARCRIATFYSGIETLWDGRLDGLIVTGAEPFASDLTQEPYWTTLTQVIDWASQNTISSVWSCLAAHAAVLKMDGIKRHPRGDKLFGVFQCRNVSDHPLTAGVPSLFRTPHSRYNDLSDDALSDCGYHLITRLKDGGVDAFLKQSNSLFVFLQGHPEYEAASLLLEYRRDIRRFLNRERDSYPSMPHDYFGEDVIAAWMALRMKAVSNGGEESLAEFPSVYVRNSWRAEAVQFYHNWLYYLFERKISHRRPMPDGPATIRRSQLRLLGAV